MPHNRHEEAERYVEAARKSMSHVAFEVFHTPSPCLDNDRLDEDFFLKRGLEEVFDNNFEQVMTILTVMDKDILIAVIEGTLPRRSRTDLARAVRDEQKQPDTMPGIYVNYVVDKDGHHATKKDIVAILAAMDKYVKEFEGVKVFSRVIDYIFRPRDPKGLKYCDNKKQRDGIQVFIDGMTDRLAGEPDGPLRGGISEVGFTINMTSRLANHAKHQESQGVMTLFDACGRHLFPSKYQIQGFPVVRVVSPLAVDMAECLISRLASSYVTFGWGFNANQAGASVQGVNSLNILQAAPDKNGKDSWATVEAEASTTGIINEDGLIDGYTAACRDEMADEIERHVSFLDANIAAQRRYHLQFKRLFELTSGKANAPPKK